MKQQKATFAGGCFWCMQHPFDDLAGVISTSVGYIGGQTPNPTYEDVCGGKTGHAEAIEITYDPTKICYETLLESFWHLIDPTTWNAQFYDKGSQYRTAIFYHNEEQHEIAEKSKQELLTKFKYIATEVVPATEFYPAEEYHQCYYQKSPLKYEGYVIGSGRHERLKDIWDGREGLMQ